jgi:hypothetical protein
LIHPLINDDKLEMKFDCTAEVNKTGDLKSVSSKVFDKNQAIENPKIEEKFYSAKLAKTEERTDFYSLKYSDKKSQIEWSKTEKTFYPTETSKSEVFDQMFKEADSDAFFNVAVTKRYIGKIICNFK